MEDCFEQINRIFLQGYDAKEIARKTLKDTNYFLIAAEHFRKAVELIENCINNFEKDIRIRMNLIKTYYIFEEKECRIAVHYRERNFEPIKPLFIEYEKCIKYLINQGKEQIELVENEEIKTFLKKQYDFWKFLESNYKTTYDAAKARDFFDRKKYVEAIDFYNENQDNYAKALDNLDKNESIKPVYKRISKGNIFGALANISSSKYGIYLEILKDDFSLSTLNNAIKEALSYIDFSECAFNANPEWKEYHERANDKKRDLKILLEDEKENWNDIYLAFEQNELINQNMKIIDNDKYQEIKKIYEKEINHVTNNFNFNNNKGSIVAVVENNGTINANNITNGLEEKAKVFLEELEKSNISEDDKVQAKYFADELKVAETEEKPPFAIQGLVNSLGNITSLFSATNGLANAAKALMEHFSK